MPLRTVSDFLLYQATPLRQNDFRILHIQPASSLSSPIVATLSVAYCNPDPNVAAARYDALSYKWGDSNDRVKVLVNGMEMSVSRSLDIALRYLRHKDKETPIWADAICINQEDFKERSVQVSLMGKIYTQAKCVRIWLGEAGPDTAAAMKLVTDCHGPQPFDVIVKRIAGDERGSLGVAELLGRPYWGRMWMFQEIVLSTISRVHCGELSAPFDGIMYMDVVSSDQKLWPDPKTSPPWILPLRRALLNTAQFTITPSALENLVNILLLTRRLDATDPRDKLFALMGTCEMAPYLAIDYNKPVRDLYVEFTRHHIAKTGSLVLLLLAGWENPSDQHDIGLPSWTPDFRTSKSPNIYIGFGIENAKFFNASEGRHFTTTSASGRTANYADGTLLTEGYILDTVQATVPLVKNESSPKEMFEALKIGRIGSNPSGKPQLQAFYETHVFDIDGVRGGETPKGIEIKKERRRKRMLGFMSDMETLQDNAAPRRGDGSVDFTALLGPDGDPQGSLVGNYEHLRKSDPHTLEEYRKKFLEDYKYNAGKVSSMIATRQNYLGRCNNSVQPGDLIAVLFGCTLPVVLRKHQSGFKLIGGCYVSGLMHGELMARPRSDLRVQSIPLV
ncbi:hypothetical protein EsH8_IX_000907 [Colletotrichum jinshuiense]